MTESHHRKQCMKNIRSNRPDIGKRNHGAVSGRKMPALVLLSLLSIFLSAGAASAAAWTIGSNGDYPNLSDALSSGKIADGDILMLEAGSHTASANVTLSKSLVIEGAGTSSTTLDMGGFSFILKKSNTTIKNLTIANSSYGINVQSGGTNASVMNCVFDGLLHADGIKLNQSGAVFKNNTVRNTTGLTTVLLVGGSNSLIDGNTLSGNTGSGNASRTVCIRNASNVSILNNTISDNSAEGLRIWGAASSDIRITGNIIANNGKGINFVDAGQNIQIWGNDIFGNTADVSGTPGAGTAWSSEGQMSYTYGSQAFVSEIGNHWGAAYTGADADGNGIGDTPFKFLNDTSEDKAPLISSAACYEIGGTAGNGTGGSGSVSGSVSLNATILPLMEFTISSSSIDFGAIRPGQSSNVQTIAIHNTGSCDIAITAEVAADSDDLYKTGLWIDEQLWSAYEKTIGTDETKNASLVLKVPRDYAGTASPIGRIIFWAEAC